jgi:hypothetical protein
MFAGVSSLANGRHPASRILGALFLICSAWSLASGAVMTLVISIFYLVHLSFVRFRDRDPRRDLPATLAFVLVILGGMGLWFHGYQKPAYHPEITMPTSLAFWRYFGALASWMFGVDSFLLRNVNWLSIGLVVATTLVICALYIKELRAHSETARAWMILAPWIGTLAAMASISLGRAGFGLEQAKHSKYAEIVLVLLPLAAAGLGRFKAGRWVLPLLWVLAFLGFIDNWNFEHRYSPIEEQRRHALSCVRQTVDGNCPMAYPSNIREHIENARALGISFTKTE